MARGRPLKMPLYVLPHGIEVVGEYAPSGKNLYWRVRIRPHRFFPGVKVISDGCHVRRSRVLLAAKLGRALTPQEHAHHGDEDRDNDTAANIELLTAAEHNRRHKVGSRHTAVSRAQISDTLKRMHAAGLIEINPRRGSAQPMAKLTEAQASTIRHSTERTKNLVQQFGVSKTVIKHIRNGSLWRHVP